MRVPLIRAVLGAAMLCGVVLAAEAPAFKSKAVKYAKLNLSGDGAKALVLAFDESKGTGQGYDTIQVMPVGFKQAVLTLTAKEIAPIISTTKAPGKVVGGYLHNVFEPFDLGPFVKAAGLPMPVLDKVTVDYFRQCPASSITMNIFRTSCAVQKEDGADKWQCSIPLVIQTVDDQAAARPITIIADKPSLKLELRQIEKGNDIGVVASTALGEQTVHITKNGQAPEVTVTVKAKNGDVVKKDSGPVGKFSLG